MSDQVKIEEEITNELQLNYNYKLESKLDENSGVFTFDLNDYSFRVKSTPSPIDCNIELLQSPFKDSEEHKKMQNAVSKMLRNTTFSANDQFFMQHTNTIINLCKNSIIKRNQKESSDAKQNLQKSRKKRNQNSYGPFFALAVQDIAKNPSELNQKFNGKGRSQKKASMKTAEDVIKRINWDKKLDPNCFIVGYEDRFDGTVERSFSDFNWKDDISAVGPEELSIPQHRITYFKYIDKIVWNKNERIDNVFGSTGGKLKIMDIVEQERTNLPNNNNDDVVVEDLVDELAEKSVELSGFSTENQEANSPEAIAAPIYIPDKETTEGASDVKTSRKPNYFIGVKVDSEEIVKNVLEIQNLFCKNKLNEAEVEMLKETFQPINKLHFTLCTCHLENDQEIMLVNQVMESICEMYSPTQVQVANVNHFNNLSVIFGRPDHQVLSSFHYKFMDRLMDSNIDVSENYPEYQSHMTLLMLRGNQFLKRKLKAFVKRRNNWRFGSQEIRNILLCKVGSTDSSHGFYEIISQFELKGNENIIAEPKTKPRKPVSSKRMDYRIGITLTAVLRHNKFGFKVDSEGYVALDDIISHPQFHNKLNATREDIYRVVRENDKKRFTITVIDEKEKIKANQGHSVEVGNLSLVPITDAALFPKVIHGTFLPVWNSIQKQGLHRKKRIHIHMTTSEPSDPNAAISGMRKSCNVYIYINIGEAMQDGLEFFQSENGVILSPGNEDGFILPKYFNKVINLDHNGKRHNLFEKSADTASTSECNEEISFENDVQTVEKSEEPEAAEINIEVPANPKM